MQFGLRDPGSACRIPVSDPESDPVQFAGSRFRIQNWIQFSLPDPGFGSRIGSSSACRIPVSDPESDPVQLAGSRFRIQNRIQFSLPDPGFGSRTGSRLGSRIEVKNRDATRRVQQVFSFKVYFCSIRLRPSFCFSAFVSRLFSVFGSSPFGFCSTSSSGFVSRRLFSAFGPFHLLFRVLSALVAVLFGFPFAPVLFSIRFK